MFVRLESSTETMFVRLEGSSDDGLRIRAQSDMPGHGGHHGVEARPW